MGIIFPYNIFLSTKRNRRATVSEKVPRPRAAPEEDSLDTLYRLAGRIQIHTTLLSTAPFAMGQAKHVSTYSTATLFN